MWQNVGLLQGPSSYHRFYRWSLIVVDQGLEYNSNQAHGTKEAKTKGTEEAETEMKYPTFITDMRHYLDEDDVLADMPNPAMNLALFFGAIVGWMTSRPVEKREHTNVPCRRYPGRKKCVGDIMASFVDESGTIEWFCPFCGDNGFIHHWQDTIWDRRPVCHDSDGMIH